MGILDFTSLPLWANLLLFGTGAGVIWISGTRLSRYVDAISEKSGLGKAFSGMVLLGGITSLPEIATTITASLADNAPLAVNNIMGGIAMQVAILAAADAATGGRALTVVGASSEELLEGVFLVLVLIVAAVAIAVGDVGLFGLGVWSTGIAVLVLLGLYLLNRYESHPRWRPVGMAGIDDDVAAAEAKGPPAREDGSRRGQDGGEEGRKIRSKAKRLPLRRLVLYTVGVSLAVLVGGFLVARTGEALADQTGLGASFVGAVLLAISTSLPEVSTTLEAVRLGEYRLAFSNIFGTNLFDAGILLVADAFYPGGPVLNEVGTFAQVGALLGALLTAVYLIGIIERQDKTVLRMGFSSLVVLVLYGAGLVLLYSLR